ncbi:1971_t:CDS:2 [Gigaspora margarita]|uniref:1971_t:CDS:1 n=1 Tax=Gigaspora margarita TaxID=4874 RepID=A0ABN7X0N7_GIGMA|nr:1971_t:CDS:2 [Gigaspora margarita]
MLATQQSKEIVIQGTENIIEQLQKNMNIDYFFELALKKIKSFNNINTFLPLMIVSKNNSMLRSTMFHEDQQTSTKQLDSHSNALNILEINEEIEMVSNITIKDNIDTQK